MIILIPAYEPDQKLIGLLISIRAADQTQRVVIVDDGSGPEYFEVFKDAEHLGCDVISYDVNQGKGVALKRGFAYIADRFPGEDVVTADCDGQHRLRDILRVADAVSERPTTMVLGARQFVGDVPFRSRFGNGATRIAFRIATGISLRDTQTGLRGFPASLLGWLQTIDGDRFEYELQMLLEAKRHSIPMFELPIETVYLEGNESSHFRPLQDSVRVYVPLLRFAASSLSAFGLDAAIFFVMMALTSNLLTSVVTARLISASTNFWMNRRFVFGRAAKRWAAARYALLAGALMMANYSIMYLLVPVAGLPLVLGKVVTEATLFFASYRFQDRFVFESEAIDLVVPKALNQHEQAHERPLVGGRAA